MNIHIHGGYDRDAGMSRRAVAAYEDGAKPVSRITLSDLRSAGWRGSKSLAVHLAGKLWASCEWHHSGGEFYNRVLFFHPDDLVSAWSTLSPKERIAYEVAAAECAAAKRTPKHPDHGRKVTGSYAIWGGSRRHPRRIGDQTFDGVLKGNWITMSDGARKSADGNHLTWSYAD